MSASRSPEENIQTLRSASRSRSPKSNRTKIGFSSSKKTKTSTQIAEYLKPNGDTKSRSRLAYQRSKNRSSSRGTNPSYYESYKRDVIAPLRTSIQLRQSTADNQLPNQETVTRIQESSQYSTLPLPSSRVTTHHQESAKKSNSGTSPRKTIVQTLPKTEYIP